MKLFLFYLLLPFFSIASETADNLFSHPFNHCSTPQIQDIAIIGERCSGTNFIRNFLANNFPTYRICENLDETIGGTNEYAHKHYFPWIDLNHFQIKKKHQDKEELNFLNNSDQTLFIFVVRDPYDWIRSFYAQPFAVHPKISGKGLWHFLTSEWMALSRDVWKTERWNPYKNRPFRNVLELREYKILNYLQVGLSVHNFLVVPYEKAVQNSEELVKFIATFFNLENTKDFTPNPYYKGWDKLGNFQKKEYPSFKKKELNFINQNINWDVEKLVGYEKLNKEQLANRN